MLYYERAPIAILLSCALRETPLAGKLVEGHVLRASVFHRSKAAAIFVDCPRLREVRTRELIAGALLERKRCAEVKALYWH